LARKRKQIYYIISQGIWPIKRYPARYSSSLAGRRPASDRAG